MDTDQKQVGKGKIKQWTAKRDFVRKLGRNAVKVDEAFRFTDKDTAVRNHNGKAGASEAEMHHSVVYLPFVTGQDVKDLLLALVKGANQLVCREIWQKGVRPVTAGAADDLTCLEVPDMKMLVALLNARTQSSNGQVAALKDENARLKEIGAWEKALSIWAMKEDGLKVEKIALYQGMSVEDVEEVLGGERPPKTFDKPDPFDVEVLDKVSG